MSVSGITQPTDTSYLPLGKENLEGIAPNTRVNLVQVDFFGQICALQYFSQTPS